MILLLTLLLSIPSGLFIAWLARDELIDGRKYFVMVLILCFIAMFLFVEEYISVSLGFIAISSWISFLKSYDSKWAVVRKT